MAVKFQMTLVLLLLVSVLFGQNKWVTTAPSPAVIRQQIKSQTKIDLQDEIDENYKIQQFQNLVSESAEFIEKKDIYNGLDRINKAFELGYKSPMAHFLRGYCLFSLEFYKEGLEELKTAAMSGDKDFYDMYSQAKKWVKDNGIDLDDN